MITTKCNFHVKAIKIKLFGNCRRDCFSLFVLCFLIYISKGNFSLFSSFSLLCLKVHEEDCANINYKILFLFFLFSFCFFLSVSRQISFLFSFFWEKISPISSMNICFLSFFFLFLLMMNKMKWKEMGGRKRKKNEKKKDCLRRNNREKESFSRCLLLSNLELKERAQLGMRCLIVDREIQKVSFHLTLICLSLLFIPLYLSISLFLYLTPPSPIFSLPLLPS